MTDCVPENAETLAVNAALALPLLTVTELGTRTALLLLLRLTTSPREPAAPERVTVQESLPDPLIDPLLQESARSVAVLPWPVPRVFPKFRAWATNDMQANESVRDRVRRNENLRTRR
ncbi:MAG TPA: hypothetical protein VHX37_14605 [Acidobacteriaceae bacterium]|nr:hypothetical protein [Acidobacteriaceae bacterium]